MKEVTKITVNGREYDSIDQMPPDVRELYLRAMASMRQGGGLQASHTGEKNVLSYSTVRESIVYNGREYKSRDDLPPEVRKLFEKMSNPQAGGLPGEVNIETTGAILPEARLADDSPDELYHPPPETRPTDYSSTGPYNRPEQDPTIAWLLVKILFVVVCILLFLLYMLNHKPGGK